MRVKLKGINSISKRLADGTKVTYWYAWKGGPRIRDPRTPEGQVDYYEACATRVSGKLGVLETLVDGYLDSADFAQRAPRTKQDYRSKCKLIVERFGDMPLGALAARGARGEFMRWRDELARSSPRQADYAWSVLSRVLSWAVDRGDIEKNPCERGGRLYHSSRAEIIWTDEDETAFMAEASPELQLAFMLAIWTGQRQGDLLRLPWSSYDGERIRLKQSKTKANVVVPTGQPLRDMLDVTVRRSPLVLVNTDGRPWTADGFRSSWRKACLRAGIAGKTFHDLRGTAVTRLALAGATESEIAVVTGHTLSFTRSMLDAYTERNPQLGENAIRKLERRTKFPN